MNLGYVISLLLLLLLRVMNLEYIPTFLKYFMIKSYYHLIILNYIILYYYIWFLYLLYNIVSIYGIIIIIK